MKSTIVLVYLFYSLTTGVAYNFYYRPNEVQHQTQVRHSLNDRAYNNQQKKTEAIFHPWGQPQRNAPTIPTIQQQAGFVFNRHPIKKAYPTRAPKQQQQQHGHGWFTPKKLAHQRPTLPVPQIQNYRNSPWSQPRQPNPQSSRANYLKVLQELGLKTVPPATLTTPFEKKKSEGYFGTFFQAIKPRQQARPQPRPQARPQARPQQSNHIAPVNNYQSYKEAVLSKNYRDYKTHEPYWNGRDTERDDNLEGFQVERTDEERAPISDHEYAKDIPTKPIYPGVGKWAKPGVKHRPYVSTQKYTNLDDEDDNIGVRPEGYDVFLEAEKIFHDQENVFKKGINAPRQFNSYGRPEDVTDWNAEAKKKKKKQPIDDFLPQQFYAQVRKTEEDLYLPRSSTEPKLTEEINDSKVHTIYTEEGYEDSAYDHAGHEKNAEVEETDKHEKDKIKTKYPKKYSKHTYIPPPEEDYDDGESSETSKTISNIRGNVYAAAGDDEEDDNNGGEDSNMAGTDGEAMMTIMKPAKKAGGKGKPAMVLISTAPAGDRKKQDSKMAADKPMVTVMNVVPPKQVAGDSQPMIVSVNTSSLKAEPAADDGEKDSNTDPMMLLMNASPVQKEVADDGEQQDSNANGDPVMLLMHALSVQTAAAGNDKEQSGKPMMLLMNTTPVQPVATDNAEEQDGKQVMDASPVQAGAVADDGQQEPVMYVMNAIPVQHEATAGDDKQDTNNARSDGQPMMYLMNAIPVQPQATAGNEEQDTNNARSDGQQMMFVMNAIPVQRETADESDGQDSNSNSTTSDSNPMMYLMNTIPPQSEDDNYEENDKPRNVTTSNYRSVKFSVTTTPIESESGEQDGFNTAYIQPEAADDGSVEQYSNNSRSDDPPMMFLMHATPVQTEAAEDNEEQDSNSTRSDDPPLMFLMHATPVQAEAVEENEEEEPNSARSNGQPMMYLMNAIPAQRRSDNDDEEQESNNVMNDGQQMMLMMHAIPVQTETVDDGEEGDNTGKPIMVLMDATPTQADGVSDVEEESPNDAGSGNQSRMVLKNATEEEGTTNQPLLLTSTSAAQQETAVDVGEEEHSNSTQNEGTTLTTPTVQTEATSNNQEDEDYHTIDDVPMMTLMETAEEDKEAANRNHTSDATHTTTSEDNVPTLPTQPTPRRLVKRDLEAQTLEVDSTANMRQKRYTIDFPNVDISTSFLDKLLAHGRRPRRKKPDLTRIKYPYYNAPGLPENSPLRYAESLNNIPVKREGNMAFYEQADRRKRCAEVDEDVDPVPDRVKNAEDEEATDVAELPDVPRLEGLGDKIECFKAKYFGEDPFDSPLFKEEYIDQPQPIFNDLIDVDVNSAEDISASEIFSNIVKDNEIRESNEPAPTVKLATPEQSEIIQSAETAKTTVPTLITTPSYTVKLTPKHIYDQIHLLDYLPTSKSNEQSEAITTEASATEVVSVEEAATDRVNETRTETKRNSKTLPLQASDSTENVKQHDPQLLVIAINERSADEPSEEVETTTATQTVEETPSTEAAEVMPKAQPLRKVRRRKKRPHQPPQANQFEIFDINDFLPPPLPSQFTFVDQPPTKRKQKPTSEVQYKEEIKPSEQLNVFEDVINNIRNTPAEPTQKPQNVVAGGNPSKIRRIKKVRIKTPMIDTQSAGSETVENVDDGVAVDDLAINYPQFGDRKPTRSVESSYGGNENVPPGHQKVYKPIGQKVVSVSQTSKTPVSEEPTFVSNNDNTEQVTQVLGLVPPDKWQYKTIYDTDNPEKQTNVTNLNTYPVAGMKPPPANQKVLTYADFKKKTPVRRVHHHLVKRDALRSRYTEIKRNNNRNKTETEKDDADDYVPRRPTSFHYDVDQDKIVYDRKTSYQSDSDDLVTRRITTNTIPTTTTTPLPTTTKKPEMNWFEYIKLLKSNEKYVTIPEPKPTEKQNLSTTTAAPVQIREDTITTPEFLTLIAKLKQDKNYMIIEEPKDSKKKTTTTTKAPQADIEVEAEESIDSRNVQNSPGGQLFEMLQEKIMDNTEPESTIKNYTPKTVIDTSKYKTIERPRVTTTTEKVSIADRRMDSTNPLEESEAQLSTPETSSPAPTTTSTSEPTSKPRRILSSKLSGTLRAPSSPRPTTKPRRPPSIYARTTTPKLSTTTTPTVESTKTFFKRRPNRTRVQTTTEKIRKETDGETDKNRTLTRRHQPEVPVNHKPVFTPLTEPTQASILSGEGSNQVNIQVTPRALTPDILYQTENLTTGLKKHEIRPRKVADVEVLKKIDKNHKHGGNYKKEEDAANETPSFVQRHQIIPRKIDSKPRNFNDQERADDVEIIKDFDETKKHGGNYKSDEEAQATAAINLLNKSNNVLKAQRDNFKRKMSTTTTTTEAVLLDSASPKDDVEIMGDYDEDKKTGGNYKSEEDAFKTDDYTDESSSDDVEVTVMPKISDVPFPNKIRRTVKRKAVVADTANSQQIQKPNEEVEAVADFDETQKHGGNLRLHEETKTTGKPATQKTTAYPAYNTIKKHVRRSTTTQSTPADPVVVTKSKSRNYEVEVVEPSERSRRRSRPYNEERRSSYSEDTVYPRRSSGSNRSSKPTRHFRRKVSVTSVVKNTVIHRPKEPEREPEDYYEERRNPESTTAQTTTEASTTTPKAEIVVETVNTPKKTEENDKVAKKENKDSISKETTPTAANENVKKNGSVNSEVSNKTLVTPQLKEVTTQKPADNKKLESSNVEAVATTTPAAETKAVKPMNEKKKHKGTNEANQSTTTKATTTTTGTTTTTTTTTTEPTTTLKPTAVKKHVRRKVSVSSRTSNKNTVTPQPKEEVEVMRDYDKNKKHGGNYKPEESNAEDYIEETTTAPKADVEVIAPMDEEKKHGGNYKPANKYHYNDDVSFIVEETSFPRTEDSPANTVKKQFRRKVSVNGEVFNKNGVNEKPKEEVEVMKDYDKAKRHGGNLKAESTASEEVEETSPPPKSEVEVVGPVDENKKHGGNYKPADEDVADGEIPIEAAESAHPAISQVPAVNAIKQHTRRRASISNESPNKLTSAENPKDDVEIFNDYDETQKHGGNYKPVADDFEAAIAAATTTTTTTTTRNTLGTTTANRRQSRRKSTTRAPTTTTTTPASNTTAEIPKEDTLTKATEAVKVSTTEALPEAKTTKASVTSKRPVRMQRTRGRNRNIVASQLDRLNDVEIIKDYDKTKQHGGNYRPEETATNRGRVRENQHNNNKAEDVEVFAEYNKAQKTGGNYRRQPRTTTTTTTTTTESVPQTSVSSADYEQEDFEQIERLTDAVPKPFSFYSDSKLPDNVNHLDDNSSKENDSESSTDDYLVGEESRTPITTTQKPFFIKDPQKRKYFYAPVK